MTPTRTRRTSAPASSNGTGASTRPNTGRTLPHDPHLERALVGLALLHPEAILSCGVDAGDFHRPVYAHTWAVCNQLAAAGSTTDAVLVAGRLGDDGMLDEIGGLPELLRLLGDAPSRAALPAFGQRLAELARARRLIGLADELKQHGYAGDLASATQLLDEAAASTISRSQPTLAWEDVGPAVRGELPLVTPTMLHRTDGAALLYPGLTHWISGEPGRAKTWVALIAAVEVIAKAGQVVMLDYEGNPRIVGGRLRTLGADPDAVAESFSYLRPDMVGPAETAALASYALDRHPSLVIVDGVAKAIARQGGDEDKAADVLGWMEAVVRPFARNGTAVLMLDHVTKVKDGRGRWARGSGAKLGAVEGVAYTIETLVAFSRTKPGRVQISIGKDREGVIGAEGDIAAVVHFSPAPDDRLAVRVDPPAGVPSDCEAAVLRVVAELVRPNQSQVLDGLERCGHRFRSQTVLNTLNSLIETGRIYISRGEKNAKIYRVTEGDG